MRYFIFLFLLLGFKTVLSQSFYYVREEQPGSKSYLGIFDIPTCQATDIMLVNTAGYPNARLLDIAVSPSGDIYCCITASPSPNRLIVQLDIVNNTMTTIASLPYPCSAMVCSADNILYIASGWGFYSYNLNTGVGIDHGPVNFQPAGDLTFRDGKLYCTAALSTNELVEVNIDNPNQSVALFEFQLPQNLSAWGVVSFVESCDSTSTYITVTDGFNYQTNQLYLLDIQNQSITYLCDTPGPILGAATINEFLASDCSLHIDLDSDTLATDWHPLPLCDTDAIPICDSAATYYSGYHTDSLRLRLLSPPDGPLEYLTAVPTGSVSVAGQGSSWLTLTTAAGTATIAGTADYQSALRSARWHNDAVSPTSGLRVVEIIAFAAGGHRDTAYSFLNVSPIISAGRDTALTLCADAQAFDLSNLLSPNAFTGGIWSSDTLPGHVFSPQLDAPGVFLYTVSGGICPDDTATISIAVVPLPVFSFGQDTSLCQGEPLLISVGTTALWQDGSFASGFPVSQSGIYWAEVTDINGCRFRDTLEVQVLPTVQTQSSLQRCAGQTYLWNGYTFSSDTVACAIFNAANSCDSTHCLTITFSYPSLGLDTALCAGQSLSWLGASYSTSGIYQDTVMLGGCLTATTLSLMVQPGDTTSLTRVICTGEVYSIGNQMFGTSGQYLVPLASVTGCDSIVSLDLTVQQPIVFNRSAGFCLGATYLFGNQALDAPGAYQQTFGCDSIVNLQLSVQPAPSPVIIGDTLVCPGGTTMLSTGTFEAYDWSGGNVSASISAGPGLYFVTVTDINGCTGTGAATVSEWPPINAAWNVASPLCHGEADGIIELVGISGGNPAFTFRLNGGTSTGSTDFSNLASGSWAVEVTDAAGCVANYEFELIAPPELEVDLGPTPPVLENGQSYTIAVNANLPGPFEYSWSPPQWLSCTNCAQPEATPLETITYSLLLSDENGCTASDSITLRVKKEEGIYVPNVFSPNGDGRNERLSVFGDLDVASEITLFRLYDRWGALVYESKSMVLNDEKSGWDGTNRGRDALPGVYVWYAEIHLTDGSLLIKNGEATLIR